MANISSLRKMLSTGCIGEFYTLNGYFFKVYPCFEIDKVKFSFVEKGKNGTGFDIYVGTDDFSLLCDDILKGYMSRKIAEDNGRYPSAWKYITGENAAKELAIGKSQKGGIVVQGRDKTGNKNAFVPIQSYDDLRILAKWYNMVSGLTPVTGYYKDLCDIFHKGVKETAKMHRAAMAEEKKTKGTRKNFVSTAPIQTTDNNMFLLKVKDKMSGEESVLNILKDEFVKIYPNDFDSFVGRSKTGPLNINVFCKPIENGFQFLSFI